MVPADCRADLALPLTGERTLPGIPRENYWFRRHEAVYRWTIDDVLPTVRAAAAPIVIDAGCGEGYGASALAVASGGCLAVDLDLVTADHLRRHYGSDRLHPIVGNLDALPVRDGSADLLVSLQVIEHLWDLGRFLRECRRVLRPGGVVVVSTPNRLVSSPGLARGDKPLNPFHVEEFDAEQVVGHLTDAGFGDVGLLGLAHGARVRSWERQFGSLVRQQVDAILSGSWDERLVRFVPSVEVSDFVIDDADPATAEDLIAVARREPRPQVVRT